VTAPLLEIESLSVALPGEHGHQPILDDVGLAIGRGEVVGLVGESGSGKSMTARSVLRLLPPGARCTGTIRLDGIDVLSLGKKPLRRLRAERLGMIFQDPRAGIDPLWTTGDYLGEGLMVNKGLDRAAARRRAAELLGDVGILEADRVLDAYPGELSGGMLQRVMIAGALAAEPDLLIADEPTTALDVTIQAEIVAIFDALRREREVGMLFITHDLELASAFCDRIVVMYAGRVVEEQGSGTLFEAPLHPYTAGLLRARPLLERRSARLEVIPGRPPSALERAGGCTFHTRCAYAEAACRETVPALQPYRAGATACRRVHEIGDELALTRVANDA
jgi:oligopeptide/dipeptide ABC transporter ATP-binding protein